MKNLIDFARKILLDSTINLDTEILLCFGLFQETDGSDPTVLGWSPLRAKLANVSKDKLVTTIRTWTADKLKLLVITLEERARRLVPQGDKTYCIQHLTSGQ